MNSIRQVYIIAAPPEDVWRALTDPKEIREWSGASALFPLEVGARYALWNGEITGRILEFVPARRLVQTWKPHDWTVENSIVSFTLTPHGSSGTQVDLYHENVEGREYAGTNEGWDIYYLGAIKKMLEGRPQKRSAPAKKQVAATKRKTKGGGRVAGKKKERKSRKSARSSGRGRSKK